MPGQDPPSPVDPPIVAIGGPTGVGKTDLAVALAAAFDGEIVSADSRQVYVGMSIGTAQPSPAELERVPHHLVACRAPDHPYSVAEFVDDASTALAAIAGRGRLAVVVGGTHHYLEALLDRLALPRVPPSARLRAKLELVAESEGLEALHVRLAQLDPRAAAEIPASNPRRVIRALEVIQASGQPFSRLSRLRGEPRLVLRLALTMPRPELYARVDQRVEQMLAAGWLDEVRGLLSAGYSSELPALSSTGYRELIAYLRGELALDEAVRRVKYSTHAFVRRQYAWLRRDPRWVWLEQGPDLLARATQRVASYLEEWRLGLSS